MRSNDKIIILVCLVLMVGLIIAAGMQLDSINNQRRDMGLIIDRPEDIPPSLAFATIATGAFRGLVTDFLWMRADRLKEEGQYFDAKQLAEWITILQPKFAAVWVFHAWNMAYNISVAIPASRPEQRWQWIKNGYELLRDEAIDKYKLRNIEIYHELARIFQHKIGNISDDAQYYYKLQLASLMKPLLSSPDNQFDFEDKGYFDALVKAPVEWNEIITDPNVSKLIQALKTADPVFSEDKKFVGNYLSLRQDSGRYEPAAAKTIDDFRGTEVLKKFDIFAKAYQLRHVWKLDPVLMREINQTYGPLDWSEPNSHLPFDWRHPDSHAIYWAVKGLKIAREDESREIDIAEINADRIVAHSLHNLFRYGKVYVHNVPVNIESADPSGESQERFAQEVFLRPDLRFFESYNEYVLNIIKKYNNENKGAYESLRNGHRNMLINALLSFYQSGHKPQAQKIYRQLRKLYPEIPDFKVEFEVFARKRLIEELETIDIFDTKEQVISLLRETFFLFAIGDNETAAGREKMAEEVYKMYVSQNTEERTKIPELKVLKILGLIDFLNDEQFSGSLRSDFINRIKIERPDLYEQLKTEVEKIRKQSEEAK